jgi:hypothetical protein
MAVLKIFYICVGLVLMLSDEAIQISSMKQ